MNEAIYYFTLKKTGNLQGKSTDFYLLWCPLTTKQNTTLLTSL
jgi:hypothetical protein